MSVDFAPMAGRLCATRKIATAASATRITRPPVRAAPEKILSPGRRTGRAGTVEAVIVSCRGWRGWDDAMLAAPAFLPRRPARRSADRCRGGLRLGRERPGH